VLNVAGERLSLREDQVDSGPGSPGGEEEREYKAWKKSLLLVLSQVRQPCSLLLPVDAFYAPVSVGSVESADSYGRYPVRQKGPKTGKNKGVHASKS
jgi:hypothetical protein